VFGSIGRINRSMAERQAKSQPKWTDVKAELASSDRTGLLSLIHDLYAAHKDNQTFLHSRLGLGENVLAPYKEAIGRWLSPDVFRNQKTSVAKARQAVSSYRKAVGEPAGLAELMVFYREKAAGFCRDTGNEDESYFNSLVRMFEQAITVANQLPPAVREASIARLEGVRNVCHQFGYGVGEEMDSILDKYD
jgi:hypothetical protein